MRPPKASEPRRSDVHARAHAAASALLQPHDADGIPEDVRTVVGYYFACIKGAERAAEQLLAYAASQEATPPFGGE